MRTLGDKIPPAGRNDGLQGIGEKIPPAGRARPDRV